MRTQMAQVGEIFYYIVSAKLLQDLSRGFKQLRCLQTYRSTGTSNQSSLGKRQKGPHREECGTTSVRSAHKTLETILKLHLRRACRTKQKSPNQVFINQPNRTSDDANLWLHLMYRSNKPHGKNQFPRLIKWSIRVISSSLDFFKTDTRNWTETKLITQMVAYQPWNGTSLLLIQFRSGANDLEVKSYQSHDEFIEPLSDSHAYGEKTKPTSVSNKKWRTFSTGDLLSALFALTNAKCQGARTCFSPVCSHTYCGYNSDAPFPSVRKRLHICEAKCY